MNLIHTIFKYVEKAYPQSLSVEGIAKKLGINADDLNANFTQYFAFSLPTFLTAVKQIEANNLDKRTTIKNEFASRFQLITEVKESAFQDKSLVIYGFHSCRFGMCCIAVHEKGICEFALLKNKNDETEMRDFLKKKWNTNRLIEDDNKTKKIVDDLFDTTKTNIPIYLIGTPFQIKVWQTLCSIIPSTTNTYKQIADNIKQPKAIRAAGTAIGKNPIAYFIPCHRVIYQDGSIGNYRWGREFKIALLAYDIIQKALHQTQAPKSF